ncbi:MAG: outer membrane protein transport protein [Desulfobacterales bacterium]|nr:outer membrane protein transport protein [Desulfobacterales bacterium]
MEISSTPNPVGSGARALGMGGAFIAVADDATAASWNPGGLIQLEKPELSVVGAHFSRREDRSYGIWPEAAGAQSVAGENVNYFSMAYPFSLFHHNMVVSLNYQHLMDFSRDVNYSLNRATSGVFQLDTDNRTAIRGSLSAVGLAYCAQVTPTFSLGFTLNFWEDWFGHNGWKKNTRETNNGTLNPPPLPFPPFITPPPVPMTSEYSRVDRYDFSGFNANVGFLWNVFPSLTLGAVFKTPFTADLDHEQVTSEYTFAGTVLAGQDGTPVTTRTDEELDMPMAYGLGIAYRFSDEFTVSGDVYRTEWQDFVQRDATGLETSPITGQSLSASDIDPTCQARLGAEYLFIGRKYVVPVRGGLFYDPAPSAGSPDDYYGFTLGTGLGYKRWIFDMAYQYRFGNDVGTSLMRGVDFSQDVKEHMIYVSLIVHF